MNNRKITWEGTRLSDTSIVSCWLIKEENENIFYKIDWDHEGLAKCRYECTISLFMEDVMEGLISGDPFPQLVKLQLALEELKR